MCMHPRGQLLVADKGNHCIRQVTEEGAHQLVAITWLSDMAGAYAISITSLECLTIRAASTLVKCAIITQLHQTAAISQLQVCGCLQLSVQ